MTQTARAINANDLQQRIDYAGPLDEVGRLAVTFDDMLARLESGFERERRFTGDAAHELRTPLTALKGHIGVTLSRPRSQSTYVETMQGMEQQVDRLIGLSNDLLFMARLQADGYQAAVEPVDLSDLLGAIVDQVQPLAEAKSISLTQTIDEAVVVHGQIDLLTRLFLNLLDNAIKYTPPDGRVSISARTEARAVKIAVRDTGPGIAHEHLPHLFERFYRVESDRGRRWGENGKGGAGLGLALADEIVRVHGGRLSVESEPGQGATFLVELPLGSDSA
jgi:signal transduction histidine kinase